MFIEYFLFTQNKLSQGRGQVIVRTQKLNDAYGNETVFGNPEAHLSECRMMVPTW